MPLQYNEYYNGNTGLTVGINKLLYSKQSKYQLTEVYETDTWGNLMTIDGMVMLSERDEFVYHEMISHVPLFVHPAPEKVLIIGGGDGGTAREVLKHPVVRQVDMVEIDRNVVEASKLHFPGVGDFENPALNVLFEDGIEFVGKANDEYDVVIIDGSDPVGPAEGLFTADFFSACHRALKSGGVFTAQTESPWVQSYHPSIKKVFESLEELFDHSSMYLCYIPLYPAGMWSMAFASKKHLPHDENVYARISNSNFVDSLRYYNSRIHSGAFALPGFVSDILK